MLVAMTRMPRAASHAATACSAALPNPQRECLVLGVEVASARSAVGLKRPDGCCDWFTRRRGGCLRPRRGSSGSNMDPFVGAPTRRVAWRAHSGKEDEREIFDANPSLRKGEAEQNETRSWLKPTPRSQSSRHRHAADGATPGLRAISRRSARRSYPSWFRQCSRRARTSR